MHQPDVVLLCLQLNLMKGEVWLMSMQKRIRTSHELAVESFILVEVISSWDRNVKNMRISMKNQVISWSMTALRLWFNTSIDEMWIIE